MLALNLSDIEHPWVVVAAMVVSEMKERLSPKKAPPTMRAVSIGSEISACADIPEAMGRRATMVPTLVPMDIEMKQAARKSPARISFPGRIIKVRFTVASTLPMALAVEAKAPARMKIQIISRTFLSPAPEENTLTLSATRPGVISIA